MAESALAHELVASNGAPNAEYYLALGRLQIKQKQFAEAEENLKQAMVLQHQVINEVYFIPFSRAGVLLLSNFNLPLTSTSCIL